MPMDYDQLLTTLIDETQENLADMDVALLTLEPAAPDMEKINQIFRIAHTIKGNSALFKLESLKNLMHTIETFLDEVRQGSKSIEKKHIEILLKISDSIRVILSELQHKTPINELLISNLKKSFEQTLQKKVTDFTSFEEKKQNILNKVTKIETKSLATQFLGWHLSIYPKKNIFKNHLDIILAFRMISEEADLKNIYLIDKDLPDFNIFDPLTCYIGWELDIIGEISKERLLEILIWIVDKQDITFTKITKKEPQVAPKKEMTVSEIRDKELKSEKKNAIVEKKETIGTISTSEEKPAQTSSTVRISTQKIDNLMNIVGELVILESILKQSIQKMDPIQTRKLDEPLNLLESQFRFLQETVLRIRMVPISFAISRFPRMVFEISNKMGKQVDFVIQGDQTEIDKTLIEKMSDPLLHLIRNAIDHGIEPPDVRQKIGKNRTGSLQFIAFQEGNNIIIEIKDDGSGIDPQKIREIAIKRGLLNSTENPSIEELYQFIFKAGFSTANQVTEYSGRGVGLDVVEKNIRAIGGTIQVSSTKGIGTTFKLKLPLTLAIMESQLIRVQDQIFIIPLLHILEISKINSELLVYVKNKPFYQFKEQNIPIILLDKILEKTTAIQDVKEKFIVVAQTNYGPQAFVCDELLIQQNIVIKSLEENFCKIPGIVGATILGDGTLGLILDLNELTDISNHPDIYPISGIEFFTRKFSFSASTAKTVSKESITEDCLCFSLGKSEYAVAMANVQEINLTKVPTRLPYSPPYLAGIINLRGIIIPVVVLGLFFNIKRSKLKEKGILIIANLEHHGVKKTVALNVDRITDTLSINKLDICPIPKASHLLLSHYIQGLVYINERIITLLEIQNLVNSTV